MNEKQPNPTSVVFAVHGSDDAIVLHWAVWYVCEHHHPLDTVANEQHSQILTGSQQHTGVLES